MFHFLTGATGTGGPLGSDLLCISNVTTAGAAPVLPFSYSETHQPNSRVNT